MSGPQPFWDTKSLHLLQELLFPDNKLALELYARIIHGYAQIGPSGIALEKNTRISFNTWFNSFYESFWLQHANLETLLLELDLSGTALVEVYREIPGVGTQRIEWSKYRALWESKVILPLSLGGAGRWGAAGRLFVDITAESDVVLSGARFKTTTPPRQRPVVSCRIRCSETAERPPAAVNALIPVLADIPELHELLILQHGDEEDAVLEAICALDPKVSLVKDAEASGLDGAEGLADTSSTTSSITHVLTVDGCALYEPLSLRNLLQFLAYAPPDIAVAAHTLDRERPWLMWADQGFATGEDAGLTGRRDLRDLEMLNMFSRNFASAPHSWLEARGLCPAGKDSAEQWSFSGSNHPAGNDSPSSLPGVSVWHAHAPRAGGLQTNFEHINELRQRDLFPLQQILFPEDTLVADLYCRYLSGHVERARQGFLLDRGAKVSFNTYFNSFYESYWCECAPYGELYLELELKGGGLVEIFRDTQDSGCQLIQSKRIRGVPGQALSVPITTSMSGAWGERGRLFVDFTAESESCLRSLRFSTNRSARTEASFTLGICTFNREPWLLRNLQSIVEHQPEYPGLKQIIVVNQGAPFRDLELASLADSSPLITLIEQRNLGGCGGFTRTMHESLNGYAVSHHVLMDDDTTLDARILGNLNHFLAYASPDIVVGGHMLDALRPCVLYEAGAMVRPNSRIKPMHHNLDLRPVDSLMPFNRCHYPDYNAWWFCAIPTDHMRAVKYPAPIFIRGDDMEYGLRLGEKGVKTVALPGIAVWHEPFYAKVGGWQLYYDLRNRLIMAAVYPHRFSMESPRNVLWAILRCLAVHDYLGAALFIKAAQDFLKGPSLMETDAQAIHAQVTQLTKEYPTESVRELGGLKTPALRPEPKGPTRIAGRLVRQFSSVLLGGNKSGKTPILLMDSEAHPGNVTSMPYVKTNGAGTYKLIYKPDPQRLRQGLAAAYGVYRAYKSGRSEAAAKWREQIPHLRGRATWDAIFSPPQAEPTSDSPPAGQVGAAS